MGSGGAGDCPVTAGLPAITAGTGLGPEPAACIRSGVYCPAPWGGEVHLQKKIQEALIPRRAPSMAVCELAKRHISSESCTKLL